MGLPMETPGIQPEERENLRSQVQLQQDFVPKLVPFADPTAVRRATVRRFGRSDRRAAPKRLESSEFGRPSVEQGRRSARRESS